MKACVVAVALVLGSIPAGAGAACPPDLLRRLLDQGYGKDEVARLCGDGGAGAGTPVAVANAKLRQLTAALEERCRTSPSRTARGDGSCDLYEEYRGILADWQARQNECSGGDETACRQLETAAGQLLSKLP